MIFRPTKLPRWTTNPTDPVLVTAIIEPSEAIKDQGFIAEKPPFSTMNWLLNLMYVWTQWFSTAKSETARIGLSATIEQATAFNLDYVSRRVSTFGYGGNSVHMKYAFGKIYISTSTNTVIKINQLTKAVEATFTGFSGPYVIESDGTRLWIVNRTNSTISVIDPTDGSLIRTITYAELGAATPNGIAFDGIDSMWTGPDGDVGHVKKININTFVVTDIADAAFNCPRAFVCDGTHMWVGNYSGKNAVKVDISTNTVTATVELDVSAALVSGGVFDGITQSVWFCGNDQVYKVNPDTETLTTTLNLAGSSNPTKMTFDGLRVWVCKYGNDTIDQIDPYSATVTRTFTFPGTTPNPLGICTDGLFVYAAGFSTSNIFIMPA